MLKAAFAVIIAVASTCAFSAKLDPVESRIFKDSMVVNELIGSFGGIAGPLNFALSTLGEQEGRAFGSATTIISTMNQSRMTDLKIGFAYGEYYFVGTPSLIVKDASGDFSAVSFENREGVQLWALMDDARGVKKGRSVVLDCVGTLKQNGRYVMGNCKLENAQKLVDRVYKDTLQRIKNGSPIDSGIGTELRGAVAIAAQMNEKQRAACLKSKSNPCYKGFWKKHEPILGLSKAYKRPDVKKRIEDLKIK